MSQELEMNVLGAIMQEPACFPRVAEILRPEHFYMKGHGQLFGLMIDLHSRGIQPDFVTVSDEVSSRGIKDLGHLYAIMASVPSGAMAEQHSRQVFVKAQRRLMVQVCHKAIEQCETGEQDFNSVLHGVMSSCERIAEGMSSADSFTDGFALADRYVEDVLARKETGDKFIGTGIPAVDNLIGGYQAGDLIVWGARSNIGKSRLLIASSIHAVRRGVKVGFISMDMGWRRLSRYLISSLVASADGYIDLQTWDDPVVSAERVRQEYAEVRDSIYDGRHIIVMDNPARSISRLYGYVRHMKSLGCEVIAIDQAQNVAEYDAESRGSIGRIVQAAKDIARSFEVCIILVHQINREGIDMPQLHHLKDSGSFEEYADSVILLHDAESSIIARHGCFADDGKRVRVPTKKDYEDETVQLFREPRNPRIIGVNIAKTRHNGRGMGSMRFDYARGVFVK